MHLLRTAATCYNTSMVFAVDTETTSMYAGQICQLAYIVGDASGAVGKNFYFTVDKMDPAAQAIHGLSLAFLLYASGGKRFGDCAEEILADFGRADVVAAHNAPFDLGFLRTECERIGATLPERTVFDTMRVFTPVCKLPRRTHGGYKFPKLGELVDFLQLGEGELQARAQALFGGGTEFHDARTDTTAVWLALERAPLYGLSPVL